MNPATKAKLAPHAEQLAQWFGAERLPRKAVRARLRAAGCLVSLAQLSEWRRAPREETALREVLGQLGEAARLCRDLEAEFGRNPPPELETLIRLLRALILKFSARADLEPRMLVRVTALMRPVIEWARLQEKRKERELAERKYRDQREAEQAARERERGGANAPGGVKPETLDQIERELKLL